MVIICSLRLNNSIFQSTCQYVKKIFFYNINKYIYNFLLIFYIAKI